MAAKSVVSKVEKGSCGHSGFCAPKGDNGCDHVDGLGVGQGYSYRCLLLKHGDSRHFHDFRPVARGWFEQSTGHRPIIATEQQSLRDRLSAIEVEADEIRARLV
jgi:hypothetical protein